MRLHTCSIRLLLALALLDARLFLRVETFSVELAHVLLAEPLIVSTRSAPPRVSAVHATKRAEQPVVPALIVYEVERFLCFLAFHCSHLNFEHLRRWHGAGASMATRYLSFVENILLACHYALAFFKHLHGHQIQRGSSAFNAVQSEANENKSISQ
jgi:hypothetical protein